MTKRAPSRNARSKGIKFKHILQICVLLGVSFWLIYQVKHSHDKKKELDEKDVKISTRAQSGDEILKFGRKDLHPRVPELTKDDRNEEDEAEENEGQEEMNKKEKFNREQNQEEEEDEEEIKQGEGSKHTEEPKHDEEVREDENKHEEEEQEDENKHEEEEQEDESKDEETEDEGREGGDDGIDEGYKGKIEGDTEHEVDFVEEEKEIEEEGDEKEIENNEGEDKELQVDHDTSLEDREDDAHEAREEHYKADDASSAVAHDSTITSTEPGKSDADASGNLERSDLNEENKSDKQSDAREEHYEADDASNAVTHDNRVKNSELDGASSDNSGENLVTKKLDGNIIKDVIGNQNSASQLKQGVTAESVPSGETKDGKISLPNPHGKSLEKTSVSSEQQLNSNKLMEVTARTGNNSINGRTDASGSFQTSETLNNTSKSTEAQKATVDGATNEAISSQKLTELENVNRNTVSDSRQLQFNLTVSHETGIVEANGKGSSNSSINLDSNGSDQTTKPDVAAYTEVDSESSRQIKEISHPAIDVNSGNDNEDGGKDDNSSSSTKDIIRAADKHEHVDSSDKRIEQDASNARIDLDTLPKDDTEGFNSKNTASE